MSVDKKLLLRMEIRKAMPTFLVLLLSQLVLLAGGATGATFFAPLSMKGLKGNVTFVQQNPEEAVTVHVSLSLVTAAAEGDYSWFIHELPVDYSGNAEERCSKAYLGAQLAKLDDSLGKLKLPSIEQLTFETNDLQMIGRHSIWGHTLVLQGSVTACGTITAEESVKTKEARFLTPVAGSVIFRSLATGTHVDTTIFANIYHSSNARPTSTDHKWQVFVTDILDGDSDTQKTTCNFLQILYDPDARDDSLCSPENPERCKIGDLAKKLGTIRVGSRQGRYSRKFFSDSTLHLPDENPARSLYVVLFDSVHQDNIYACARIREVKPKVSTAILEGHGVEGNITFKQTSPFDVTSIQVHLQNLQQGAALYHVHEFPVPPKMDKDDVVCSKTAGHYNPYKWDVTQSPAPGMGTDDQYELGDISGKHGTLQGLQSLDAYYLDTNMPLFGSRSIQYRSIVIHKPVDNARWLCGNIQSSMPTTSAVVTFRYPMVGRILFTQTMDDPWTETSILVESLVYSDGSKNDTDNHRWHVHVNVPSKDYYNWTERCLSAGEHYNPYQVSVQETDYKECNLDNPFRCELGDMENRHGRLEIAGSRLSMSKTKRMYTDVNLPLSGQFSIIGKSIVVYEDNGPKARGERLACSQIVQLHRQKAVAMDWFGNGEEAVVSGKLEFIQENRHTLVSAEVKLQGLQGITSGYHVHLWPVPVDLVFPCEDSAVSGHYNPFQVDPKRSPPPSQGSPDEYEMGDLSGKYGTLDSLEQLHEYHNDTNLMLFGYNSIIGRSIVVHKKEKNHRWMCATIVRGYATTEAHEYRAIASFHHPQGFAWGYIRLTQLVYHDGGTSDTVIEVNLKHPGTNDKNVTRNHKWSVYVNPVAQDAAVKIMNTRCVAGGFRYNPYFIQLAQPNDREYYEKECKPDNPLRCDVGDISGRLGPIDIGGAHYVFSDPNLPLSGPASVLGRSIVIHNEGGGPENFACANILPDKDTIKYANIKKPPRFIESEFLKDVRGVMGIPEWMLIVDNRKTKVLHDGRCVQFLLHFMGPYADRLELDFLRLLHQGELSETSIQIIGALPNPKRKTKLPYRHCDASDSNPKGTNDSAGISISAITLMMLLLVHLH